MLTFLSRIFYSYWYVNIGLQRLDLSLALFAFEEEGIFIVPYISTVTRNPGFCGRIQNAIPFNCLFSSVSSWYGQNFKTCMIPLPFLRMSFHKDLCKFCLYEFPNSTFFYNFCAKIMMKYNVMYLSHFYKTCNEN